MKKSFIISLIITGSLLFLNMRTTEVSQEKVEKEKHLVTFIELGSVRCIPCKKMEPILENIRKKYPKDVKVVFHDVWTEKGLPFVKKYKVQGIPTQVFLDKDGKEFFRHEGFFPEEDLIKVLKLKGVKN